MGLCQCSKSVQGIETLEFSGEVKALSIEEEVYAQVADLLSQCDEVHKAIETYKGCQELARAAMSNPNSETELAAFQGLLSAVESIQIFYNFSKSLEKVFPILITKLSENVKYPDKICRLDDMPGLTRQLSHIFDFALKFDRIRMLRPNLSNDFSYYRRLLPKFNKHPEIKVKDDEASGMALFTAEHIPMTTCLAKSGAKAQELLMIKEGKAADGKIGYVLATLANSCMLMLKNNRIADDQRNFAGRAMTGSVVIFDHVDHLGAFHRRTPVAIKPIINCLKKEFATEMSLLNAIRYSTKNFRDAPEAIQAMFD